MKKLISRFSRVVRVSHSSQYSTLRSDSLKQSHRSDVPEGHFPVYVGIDEMERFIVNAQLLHHPIFIDLLNRSAQEYGYEQRGVLRIPISVVVFERLLESLRLGQEPSCLDDLVHY